MLFCLSMRRTYKVYLFCLSYIFARLCLLFGSSVRSTVFVSFIAFITETKHERVAFFVWIIFNKRTNKLCKNRMELPEETALSPFHRNRLWLILVFFFSSFVFAFQYFFPNYFSLVSSSVWKIFNAFNQTNLQYVLPPIWMRTIPKARSNYPLKWNISCWFECEKP